MSLRLLLRYVLLCVLSVALTACPGDKGPEGGYYKINTFVVSDSCGYKVGKGTAYATVFIDDPSGLSELCKKNYAMWVSTVLQVDPTSDKEPIKSLAAAYARTEALKNQAAFQNNKEELDMMLVREVYTKTGIRKIYEDKDYISFLKEDTIFSGDQTKSNLTVGYTFTKTDFTLVDLVDTADIPQIRRLITEQLGKTLVKKPEQLLDYLLIEDDCRKQGLVPLPANGAFLLDDSLVFLYQEYEIAPYKAGRPCVKLPFKRKNIAVLPSDTVRTDTDFISADSLKSSQTKEKSNAEPKKSKTESKHKKSEAKKSKTESKHKKSEAKKSKSESKSSKSSDKSKNNDKKSKKSDKKSSKSKKSDKKTSKK